MQELPRHTHQAGLAQLSFPRYLQECEGPGSGPAGKLTSDLLTIIFSPSLTAA